MAWQMKRQSQVDYWVESAKHDLDVAETLFNNHKYDWCLFVSHLVLEKILKAAYVKNVDVHPPRTHDLVRLTKKSGVELDEETLEFLDAVNTFNISTRYPDERMKYYKMCTHAFTKEQFDRIKEIYRWLLKIIKP